jgi:anti-sigma factor RsiW
MNHCRRLQERDVHLYVDNELSAAEVLEFERHLLDCSECCARFQQLRAVVDVVRGAQPLYEVPEHSRQGARAAVARCEQPRRRLAAAAACAAMLAVLGLLWLFGAAAEFTAFAADSHHRYASGMMPLDVASSDPEIVTRWLASRLPFHLQLPNYPEGGGEKRYHLVGARLLQYRNRNVAFLAYEMDRKPISLLMTSDAVAAPSGGALYRSGALKFHFSERDSLNLIAWTDRGVHYSLVSALGARGAESCIICHGGAGERRVIDALRPGREVH